MVHHLMVRYIVSVRHFLTLHSVKKVDPDTGIPCDPQSKGCLNAFEDVAALPYCDRHAGDGGKVSGKRACRYYSIFSDVHPFLKVFLMMCTHIRECF